MTRSALWLPLFDELASPPVVTRLAVEAEEYGWDGFFVWDHIVWRPPVQQVADPWIVLAAVAAVTDRLVIGPMVTPLARRRPTKVARETATLDQLSAGRLVLGVGLGSDRSGNEFSGTGECADDRVRASILDESLQILRSAWSGDPVQHRGEHYLVDGIAFRPRPRRARVPVWVGGFAGMRRPMQRAAAHDGYFPVNLTSVEQFADAVGIVRELRGDAGGSFDIAVEVQPGVDPAPYVAAGATWCLTEFDPATLHLDTVRGVLRDGPWTGSTLH